MAETDTVRAAKMRRLGGIYPDAGVPKASATKYRKIADNPIYSTQNAAKWQNFIEILTATRRGLGFYLPTFVCFKKNTPPILLKSKRTRVLRPAGKGPIISFLNHFKMKNSKVLSNSCPPPPQITLFLFILNLFFAANLFVSCGQEAKDVANLPDGKTLASERGGCDLGECAFTIEALNNCTVEACGDINPSISGCNFGCNTLTNDRYNVTILGINDEVVYCVPMNGSICLRNSPTASSDAEMYVYFEGTSTPIYVAIPPGEVRCFHTNSSCATIGGCF